MPQFVCELEIPTRPEDLVRRYHNQYMKEAVREAAERWWQHEDGFKSRFKREAKTRFHHFERQEKYKQQKARKYHSTVDLIKTGKSKEYMLSVMKFQIGGSAEGGKKAITLSMTTRFAFKGGTGRMRNESAQGLKIQQMQLELQDADERDGQMISKWILEGYMRRLNQHRQSRRRVRLPKK